MSHKTTTLLLLIVTIIISSLTQESLGGFQEKGQNGNSTFDCSPSGPCVPCQYSEKSEDKYRCSETGYRIPFKCTGEVKQEANGKGPKDSHSTKEGSSTNKDNAAAKDKTSTDRVSGQEVERHEYVTYRSCTQDVDEEKLSVLGFEVIVLGLLLVSGSFVVLRQKKTVPLTGTGGVRLQSNPRF